jgi:hypothetical protein
MSNKIMTTVYEYLVCQTQAGRITFVNGQWQGSVDYRGISSDTALNSCPQVWDYLNRVGQEGWELVASAEQTVSHLENFSQVMCHLFLKRASS